MQRFKVNFLLFVFGLARRFFGVDFPPAPTVCAIINRGNEILVIDSSYKDGFVLPGGFLKGKENFVEGLEREVLEETSLKVQSVKYLGTYSTISKVGQFPKATVCFRVQVKGRLKSSAEGKPIWIDAKEALKQLAYEDNVMALKDFLKSK